jgi:hypothetical protein
MYTLNVPPCNEHWPEDGFIKVKVKPRRMRWAGHVARKGRREASKGLWWGNLRERDHWGDPGIDGRIILGWIFWKWDVGVWTGLVGSGQRQVAGTCECENEPSGSITCGEFLE